MHFRLHLVLTETTVDIMLSVGLVLAEIYRKPAVPVSRLRGFVSIDGGLGIGIPMHHGTHQHSLLRQQIL